MAAPRHGAVELHFTYDEEFGGLLGPGWLLRQGLTRPDLLIAAGFSYAVVSAHNGCLQMEVTVHGEMAHAAVPETGVDALQGAVRILNALYAQNARYREVRSQVPGITHPYLNVGRIEGGTNTNVVPGKVSFKLDRRMIPEENAAEVEADIHRVIEDAAATFPGIRVEIKRLLLANAMRPLPGNKPLVDAIQRHGREIFGEDIPALGTPLYTDVRLYAEAGIPGVIYGAGARCWSPTPSATTNASRWKTCAAPPRSSPARWPTCCSHSSPCPQALIGAPQPPARARHPAIHRRIPISEYTNQASQKSDQAHT